MKNIILPFVILGATVLGISVYSYGIPSVKPVTNPPIVNVVEDIPKPESHKASVEKPIIEAVFVLDTTGSMGGMIEGAKQKIWSIASTMASSQQVPDLKLGLVAFRDKGDDYVTKHIPLSTDIDSVYASLMDLTANGGGDGPESVNQALFEAVTLTQWSQNPKAYKVIFLVGDAEAHMDYPNEKQYPEIVAMAKQQGIVVNSILCGENVAARRHWQQIAQLGNGEYFNVEQNGSALAVSTPYDEKIAALSKDLDDTRLYYGDKRDRVVQAKKLAATEKVTSHSSVEALARRGVFNASKAGKKNLWGEKDLVADVIENGGDLDAIAEEELPAPLKSLDKKARYNELAKIKQKRDELQKEIASLGEKRQQYIKKELAEKPASAPILEDKIFKAVKEQAEAKGLEYSLDESLH